MVNMRATHSLTIAILRIFRSNSFEAKSVTREELVGELVGDSTYFWLRPFDVEYWLDAQLEELVELGLIIRDVYGQDTHGLTQWRVAESWQPTEGGGRGSDIGPPGNGGGDGGDGREEGGGGLREALGHPVLFALSRDDFSELVDGLFEEDDK